MDIKGSNSEINKFTKEVGTKADGEINKPIKEFAEWRCVICRDWFSAEKIEGHMCEDCRIKQAKLGQAVKVDNIESHLFVDPALSHRESRKEVVFGFISQIADRWAGKNIPQRSLEALRELIDFYRYLEDCDKAYMRGKEAGRVMGITETTIKEKGNIAGSKNGKKE